jgi:hypothetical protein
MWRAYVEALTRDAMATPPDGTPPCLRGVTR